MVSIYNCNICYQNDAPLQCKACLYNVCMECIYTYGQPHCPACFALYDGEIVSDIRKSCILNTFRQYLKNDKLFLVRKKMVNFDNDNIELVRSCPKCLKYIVKKNGEGVCCSCGFIICLECEENHQGACDKERLSSIKFLNEKYMKCPACLTYIEKVDGCNHMRCLSCGSQFNSENSKEIYYRKFNYMDLRDNNLVYTSRNNESKLTDLDTSVQYYDYLDPFKTWNIGELINNYLLEVRYKNFETIHSLIKPFLDSRPGTDEIIFKLLTANKTIEDFSTEYDPKSGKDGLYNSDLYQSLFFVIDNIIKTKKPPTYCIRNIIVHGEFSNLIKKYTPETGRQHTISRTTNFRTTARLSIVTESNDSLDNISKSLSLIEEIKPSHLVILSSDSEKERWVENLLESKITSKTDIIFYDDIEKKNTDFFSLYEGEENLELLLGDYITNLIKNGRAMVVFGRIPTSPNIILSSFLSQLVSLIKKNQTIFHIHGLVEYRTNEVFRIFKPLLNSSRRRLRENTIDAEIKVLEIDLTPDEKIFYSQCFTDMGIILDGERYVTKMREEVLNVKGLLASENLFMKKMVNNIPLSSHQNLVLGLKFDSTIGNIKSIYREKGYKPLTITSKTDKVATEKIMNRFQNEMNQILLININAIKKIPVLSLDNDIHINAFLFTDFDFRKTINFISLFNKPTTYVHIIDPTASVNSIEKLQQYIWSDIPYMVLKDLK